MSDLAVIIVSHNSRDWLVPCLSSVYAYAGSATVDVIVVDNASTDGSAELVETQFPQARVLREANRGFAFGNNRGVLASDAPYVLFLNADAEIVSGTLGELVDELRARPEVGLVGCRQLTHGGDVYPTIRRFPHAVRLFFESIGSEQLPLRSRWLGERELDMALYDQEVPCDWVSGSFMLARREAVLAAGLMDERFFLFCEEPDLCQGIKRAGWDVRYLPSMTILHPWDREGSSARLVAQEAYAHRQYFVKHFSLPHRVLALAAYSLGHALRAVVGGRDASARAQRRATSRRALRTVLGLEAPPFGAPAAHKVLPLEAPAVPAPR